MLKYEKGKIVKAKITGIEKYGAFVSIDDSYSGLIHISEITDEFVKNVSDYFTVGEIVKVRIVENDEEKMHLKLSVKNLDYRDGKIQTKKLKEVSGGFKPLENELEKWMDIKLNELSK